MGPIVLEIVDMYKADRWTKVWALSKVGVNIPLDRYFLYMDLGESQVAKFSNDPLELLQFAKEMIERQCDGQGGEGNVE